MKYAIYSDGSYKNGIWGAGAVILQETPFGFNPVQELSFYGEDADGIRNVAGEIYGVLEALRLLFKINQSSRDVDSVTVYHVKKMQGMLKTAVDEIEKLMKDLCHATTPDSKYSPCADCSYNRCCMDRENYVTGVRWIHRGEFEDTWEKGA